MDFWLHGHPVPLPASVSGGQLDVEISKRREALQSDQGRDPGKSATQQWTYNCCGDVSRAEWKTGQVAVQGSPCNDTGKEQGGATSL